MTALFGNIVNLISVFITCIIFIGIIIRLSFYMYGKEKTVDAIIVDKQCYEKKIYKKFEASVSRKEYIAVFSVEGKRLSFKISENTYKSYTLNQKGKLTYKGSRLMGFKKK